MIGRLRAALPALHERDFRLLFGGQAISVVGDALFPVALAFAVLELSGSATSLGLVLAAQALPLAALVLVGGVVGDRFSRQKVMLASDLARAAVQAVAAGLLIALFGPGSAIAIDAASFLVSAACLWAMRPRPGARMEGEPAARFLHEVRDGWREVTSRAWLRSFLVVIGAYHLIALPCVLALGPLVADREAPRAGR